MINNCVAIVLTGNNLKKPLFMKSNFYAPARVIFLAILLIVSSSIKEVYAQQFLTKIDGWNAYVHLPAEYNDSTSKRYPVIIFIPGTGETGTDPSKLLSYGPSKFVAAGHNMEFTVNGKVEKPIVISLQPVALWPSAYTINRKLDTIFNRYRCDLQRINATGLSMGGWSWDNYVDGYNPIYTNRITSIVAMSAPEPDNTIGNMRLFSQAGGKWWGFEGTQDYRKMSMIHDTLNYYVPGSSRYTSYVGGHCCWNTWYNPTWTENGESIYTWMLKQRKPASSNIPPQANAGRDTALATIISTYSLAGFGNDPDGNPIQYQWTKVQGPNGIIGNPAVSQTSLTGLAYGLYKFEFKVTDALGAVSSDTLIIANGMAALPVKLTDFSAMSKVSTVLLQWKTSTEINSSHFEIERESSAGMFEKIAQQTTSGNSNIEKKYAFTDRYPVEGINFYRLKIIDHDGSYEYSKTVSVNIKNTLSSTLSLSGSHLKNNLLQMNVSSRKEQNVIIVIFGSDGKKYQSTTIKIAKGYSVITTPTVVQKGIYYVQLITDTEKVTSPMVGF